MWLGSQSETLLCIREQSLSRGASQSAVRCRWLSLCTVWSSHSQWPSEQISFITTMRLPILQLSCSLFWQSIIPPKFVRPTTAQIWFPATSGFSEAKIAVEREEFCKSNGHRIHKLSQRRLTADCLVQRKSDCTRKHNKVSSDWLPSYIKATRPVLDIFKMDGYFPDSPPLTTAICLRI
jgi:hypothetical protein